MVNNLIYKLEEIDTEMPIFMVVEDSLMNWKKIPKEKYRYNALPRETRIALDSQDKLRWTPFINGRIATTWEDAQGNWIIRISTRYKRPSHVWSATFIEYLL